MTAKTKKEKTPVTTEAPDYSKVYLCVWRDSEGIPRAYGADVDKKTARKLADKSRVKYEKKNSTDLVAFDISTVSLSTAKA